jgi:hypothetical protein
MFLEGGPAAPVAPAAPAPAPVPAPAAPAPAPTPIQPEAAQRSLADAQLTGPLTMPAEPQAAPAPVPAEPQAPAQVSPDAAAQAEQRVKDAQRKMHQSTAEAAALRNQLNSILNHPLLGPVVQQITNPQAPAASDPLQEAWKAYQAAPTDEAAFRHLVAVTQKNARDQVMQELENKRIAETNTARAQQRDMLVAQAINKEVAEKAPDVPLELFWAMSTKAELETPATLITVADKLQWQIERAVELARNVLTVPAQRTQTAQTQSQQVRQTAAVVMPSGSDVTSGGGGQVSSQPANFVEQLRQAQARKVGRI